MKKYTLTFCFCLGITAMINGQTVNNIPIQDIDAEYIQIVATYKPVTSKVYVEIDFGQESSLLSTKQTVIKDTAGKKVEFNSIISALNFMSRYGYEFVQAYTSAEQNGSTCYILRKKKAMEE